MISQFMSLFEKMIELLLIIAMGYIANKCGIFDKESRRRVTMLVMNIGLPCLGLGAVMTNTSAPTGLELLGLVGIAILSYLIMYLIAVIFPRLLRVPSHHMGQSEFMLFLRNCAFIGIPVAVAVYGNEGVFYTMIANTPFSVLCYSVGVGMIRGKAEGDQKMSRSEKILYLKKLLITVPMISSLLSLTFSFIGFRGTPLIAETLTMIGQITTPLALMVVGSSLAEVPFLQMMKGVRIYILSFVVLIVTPALCWILLSPLCSNMKLLGCVVLMTAMPTASTGTMLCVQYRKDETYMAQCTFITTILSMVTLPLVATAIQYLTM